MQNYHMDDKAWDDIGYNFLIGGDGIVYECRGMGTVGAHTKGFNANSIGISLIGRYSFKEPSETMLTTTKQMIQYAKDVGALDSDKLHGHKDAGSTSCPGDKLYSIIEKWPNFEAGPVTK